MYLADGADPPNTGASVFSLIAWSVLILYFVGRKKKADATGNSRQARSTGSGVIRPKGTLATQPRHEADSAAKTRRAPFGGFPTWGPPRTGDRGGLTGLIRARRFADASAAVRAGDRRGRARLAIARLGPAIDVYRVATSRPLSWGRRRARTILAQCYPQLGTPRAILAFWRFDPVQNHLAIVERHTRNLRFDRAGQGYEALARKFPKADDTPEWLVSGAMAYGLAGRLDDAKRLARWLVDTRPGHPISESASRYLRKLERLAGDEKPHTHFNSAKVDSILRDKIGAAKFGQYPRWPGQIARISWGEGNTMDLADLTPENVVSILDAGATPYASLTSGPRIFIRAICALSTGLDVVSLSDGNIMTWDGLVSRSQWGRRVAVVRPNTLIGTWTIVDPHGVTSGPPLGPGASPLHDAAGLLTMRERARKHPEDPSVVYGYIGALLACPLVSENQQQRNSEVLRMAAIARLRFGEYVWARYYWTLVTEEFSAGADIQTLGSLDGLASGEPSAILSRALARAEPSAASRHLREAAVQDPFHRANLGRMLEAAERNGDAAEFDAVFRFTEKVLPKDIEAPRHRRTRLVLKHGPRDAFPRLTAALGGNGHDIASARAALATHAADPELLAKAADEANAAMPADPTGALCRVLIAIHRADVEGAIAGIDRVIAHHGFSQMTMFTLLDIANGLVTSSEARTFLARADGCMGTQPWSVRTLVTELRTTHLWREGLEVGRRLVRAGTLPAQAEIATVEGILHALGLVGSDERLALADEGTRLLESVPEFQLGPSARHMKAALERFRDPRRAWDLLREADVVALPLVSLALAAEIAEAQGDPGRAGDYRARMANPDLIIGGLASVSRLGLTRAVEGALVGLDPDLFPHAAYDLYAAGGKLPRLPRVPTADYTRPSIQLLDRLGRNSEWTHLERLHRARFIARVLLTFEDGAYGASLLALARAGQGAPKELKALAERSQHPAVLRALAVAEAAGLGFAGARTRAARLAPGALEDLDFLGVDR